MYCRFEQSREWDIFILDARSPLILPNTTSFIFYYLPPLPLLPDFDPERGAAFGAELLLGL